MTIPCYGRAGGCGRCSFSDGSNNFRRLSEHLLGGGVFVVVMNWRCDVRGGVHGVRSGVRIVYNDLVFR